MKQLQKDLIEGGLVAHLDDDNIMMLVSHGSKSITREDILEALHGPEQLHGLSLIEKDGVVLIFPRNIIRKRGINSRGPIARNKDKMFRLLIGPVLDEEMQRARDWCEDMSPEARMMQWLYRYEDWHRDQLEALERSMGNGT